MTTGKTIALTRQTFVDKVMSLLFNMLSRLAITFLTRSKREWFCCRKADPFQGPKLGSCLTLGNELSKETHVLTKQEILLGKGTRVESSRVESPLDCKDWGQNCSAAWLTVSGLW